VDVNRDDVRDAPVLRIAAYWQTSRRPGEVLRVQSVVLDLVANGTLEWEYTPRVAVRPFGYASSMYGVAAQQSEGVEDAGERGGALCLTRLSSELPAGLEGPVFPVWAGHSGLLVQAADIMSPDGGGYALGRRWYGDSGPANPYSYVASGPSAPSDWTTFAGTETLSAEVQSVRLWIMNVQGRLGARTCFSNLFMFEVPAPPQA
jgi:hypothetical protein